jgi:hypothetical protein
MRLFERTLRAIRRDEHARNKYHRIFWKYVATPLATIDLGYVLIKTKGNIDEDAFWNNLTDELFTTGHVDVGHKIYELGDSYRREILKKV